MLSFIQNRPPLVVVFFCILTAALTLTLFAFYVNRSELILDNDVIYDWNQLLKHFNELETCVQDEPNSDITKKDDSNIETVNTFISISSSDLYKYSSIQGSLITEGWHPVCDKNNYLPTAFKFAFNVPNVNSTSVEVCATITGPEKFLPKFLEPICNVTHTTGNKSVGTLLTSIKKHKNFCTNGTLSKVTFHPGNMDNFANYINFDRKDVIYVHLLWSVYVLFGVLLIIFIYTFLESNRHMKYIEKCSSLIQR